MKKELSVLIPTYNCFCGDLVHSMHHILEQETKKLEGFRYEIIVVDDGSTDKEMIEKNQDIKELSNVNYIIREKNVGRASIRNFLAQQAQYEWLLFLDGDIMVERTRFIEKYLDTDFHVIVGGLQVYDRNRSLGNNLRFLYELKYQYYHGAAKRQEQPYKEFRTINFLVQRDIMLRIPFDEEFKHYGYEDVLFGKQLKEAGIRIRHISNPVMMIDFEDNPTFVSKTEESLRTLHQFRNELKGYSTLLKYEWMKPLFLPLYYLIGKLIRWNLTGNNPRLSLFNIYKLLYYSSL